MWGQSVGLALGNVGGTSPSGPVTLTTGGMPISLPWQKHLSRLIGWQSGRPAYTAACPGVTPWQAPLRLVGYQSGRPVYAASVCSPRPTARLIGYTAGRPIYTFSCCPGSSYPGSEAPSSVSAASEAGSLSGPSASASAGSVPAGSLADPGGSLDCCFEHGLYPAILHATFSDGFGTCTCLNGITVTLIRFPAESLWRGSFTGCGGTSTFSLLQDCSGGFSGFCSSGLSFLTADSCDPLVLSGRINLTGCCFGSILVTVTI